MTVGGIKEDRATKNMEIPFVDDSESHCYNRTTQSPPVNLMWPLGKVILAVVLHVLPRSITLKVEHKAFLRQIGSSLEELLPELYCC